MHVPDGFFNAATSVSAGVVTAGTVGISLKKAARDLADRLAPMAVSWPPSPASSASP